MSRPWWRKTNKAWYATIGGQQELLCKAPSKSDRTCSYAYRHTFTTEGLERGVPVATMAELLGNQDLAMISRHYGHLNQKSQHLRAAAEQAGEVRSSSEKT